MQVTITIPRETEAALLAEAALRGENLQTLIEKILREKAIPMQNVQQSSDAEFDRDFADFAADAPSDTVFDYSGSYPRADIYAEHD